jgi:hypothetical protein
MSEWLTTKESPAGFSVDRECELKQPDSEKSLVRYARHTLEIDEVGEHIRQGKVPTQLAMTWNGRVSFVLTESLRAEEDQAARRRARGAFEARPGRRRLRCRRRDRHRRAREADPDLVEALGGPLTLGEAGTTPAPSVPSTRRPRRRRDGAVLTHPFPESAPMTPARPCFLAAARPRRDRLSVSLREAPCAAGLGGHQPGWRVSLTGALTGAPARPRHRRAPLTAARSRSLGAWQEGLRRARAQAARRAAADIAPACCASGSATRSSSRPDHTTADLPALLAGAELPVSRGWACRAQWRVDDGQTLQVTADRGAKSVDAPPCSGWRRRAELLRSMATRPQVLGRYDGPLPPDCR